MFMVLAMAASLTAAGCGGSDDSAEAAPPIAKAAFIKQANAICVKVTQKRLAPAFKTLLSEYAKAEGDEQKVKQVEVEYVTGTLVPIVQAMVDEIRAAGLPRGDEKKANEILDSYQEAIDEAEENPEDYPQKVNFAKARGLAQGFGLTSCKIS
ncbi:MAG TPA: hypothetical protein VLK89_02450 [Solirubrobacterales bacterium]|nr:hypothetical protein [Solirubrobacterales bacterium]